MLNNETTYPFCDLALAQRLERVEAQANIDFVEERAAMFPDSGARWVEVGGTRAMYDGVDSPLTQTFCLGVYQPVTPADMDTIEAFYQERGAPVYHEVSPVADPTALELLNARGYQPMEFTSVMCRPIGPDIQLAGQRNQDIQVRVIDESEVETWAGTATRGWSEHEEFAHMILELSRISARCANGYSFLAELDGQPVAAGGLRVTNGVALLAGASTIPEARRHGAQRALLEARLAFAATRGCDLAMMCAASGSGSQRNAERQAFRIAYTRIKWRKVN
ncbi:MAG: GNAT family N-acetyltransferase [Blastocatellia bacterium]